MNRCRLAIVLISLVGAVDPRARVFAEETVADADAPPVPPETEASELEREVELGARNTEASELARGLELGAGEAEASETSGTPRAERLGADDAAREAGNARAAIVVGSAAHPVDAVRSHAPADNKLLGDPSLSVNRDRALARGRVGREEPSSDAPPVEDAEASYAALQPAAAAQPVAPLQPAAPPEPQPSAAEPGPLDAFPAAPPPEAPTPNPPPAAAEAPAITPGGAPVDNLAPAPTAQPPQPSAAGTTDEAAAAPTTKSPERPWRAAAMLGLGVTFDHTVGGVNPLGFGFGLRGDYHLRDEFRIGARLLYFVGGSSELPTGTYSMSSWLLAAEGAYVLSFAPLKLEPGLALGVAARNASGRPAFASSGTQAFVPGSENKSDVGLYVAPGIGVILPLDELNPRFKDLFVGLDVRLDLVFGAGVTSNLQLLFEFGLTF
jgi:hypothetical protein